MPTAKQHSRILLIAPAYYNDGVVRLDTIPEVDTLYDLGYNVQTVQEHVTRERLFQIVRNRQFEIVHFAGHSSPDGWLLDDGKLMETAAIVQLARSAHANLVFINGCASAEIGQVLVDEHVPAAICLLGKVEDATAKETAQVFYQKLAEVRDVRTAYGASKPPLKGGYSLFTNGGPTPATELLTPILREIETLSSTVARLESSTVTVDALRDIQNQISGLRNACTTIDEIKRWGLRVFVVTFGIMIVLEVGIIMLVRP